MTVSFNLWVKLISSDSYAIVDAQNIVRPVFFNLSVFRSADRNFTQNGKKIKLNFLIFIFR